MFVLLTVADQHRQIETQVRNVRKGPPRVETQRCQNRKNRFREVPGDDPKLGVIQFRVVVNPDALFPQLRQNRLQAMVRLFHQAHHLPADGHKLCPRAHAIEPGIHRARVHLRQQPGDANHKKLVEVGPQNRQELQPLQRRVLFVLRLLQHAPLKCQQRQLAVHVQFRVPQVNGVQIAWGKLRRHIESNTLDESYSLGMRRPTG
jgi:hypothetical protein